MSKELFDLVIQVIKSWQVLAVTGALILYILLVSYVARLHHRPRQSFKKVKAINAAPEAAAAPEETSDDELGLEEE
ncbi:MAG: hypothetical protein LBQ14_02840 [Treponema sp.]|jgi:hypothetical protein|nr:hypothetical protein [Treponema sp.]